MDDMTIDIRISKAMCKSCGICVELCQYNVLKMIADNVLNDKLVPCVENIEDCVGCGMCEMFCPDFAISIERQVEEIKIE